MDVPALISILVPAVSGKGSRQKVLIVLHRAHARLADPIRNALKETNGAVVVVDRRGRLDRRRRNVPVAVEWRGTERRRQKATIADVVIEGIGTDA